MAVFIFKKKCGIKWKISNEETNPLNRFDMRDIDLKHYANGSGTR